VATPVLTVCPERPSVTNGSAAIPEITIDTFDPAAAGMYLIDVREPDEYTDGHLAGAVSIPLSDFMERIDEVPTDRALHLICAHGGRSMKAAQYLASKGLTVTNVDGGTVGWTELGRAVVAGSNSN